MPQNQKIISHLVQQGDQLERLARRYMGDAAQWIQIALLNDLDYPYLTDDAAFVRDVPATGTVTFTRTAGSTGAVVIPAQARLFVPATPSAPLRVYTTDGVATIPDGLATVDQTITAAVPGDLGNTPALTVTGLGFGVGNLAAVTNAAPVTGGVRYHVKFPGETLLVYTDAAAAAATPGVDTQALRGDSFYTVLLGTDIALDATGDLFGDSRGGMALIAGMNNLRDALRRRLGTALGWYAYLPAYGTTVERSVGERGTAARLQAVAIDAERTVRGDPRVADVQNVAAHFQAGGLHLSMDLIVIGETNPMNLVVQLPAAGDR